MSLFFLLLGFGFASKLRSFHVATTAELFETKYNKNNFQICHPELVSGSTSYIS